jgi:hypothetical protein
MRVTSILLSTFVLAAPAVAGLVPGGGKAKSDCYAELEVTNLEAATVKKSRVVTCRDGDPCDVGECGDDSCTFEVGLCVNQTDPALARCTPPASLTGLDTTIEFETPTLPIEGPGCFDGGVVEIPLVQNSKGHLKPASAKIEVTATAAAGTRPSGETDRFVLKCIPRSDDCGSTTSTIVSSSSSTTLGSSSTTTSVGGSSSSSSSSSSTTVASTSTSLPGGGSTTSTNITSTTSTTVASFDCTITSAACDADICSCAGLPGLDYHLGASGTATGPVGTQVRVNVSLAQGGVIDCGQWTKIGSAVNLSCDTIGCCEREEGQPEATGWTAFEAIDLPCFCPSGPGGLSTNYLVQCQYKALPVIEHEQATSPCP